MPVTINIITQLIYVCAQIHFDKFRIYINRIVLIDKFDRLQEYFIKREEFCFGFSREAELDALIDYI